MNMFARFDENPAMTLHDIKATKRYGRTDGCTHGWTVYPPQTKFVGGGGLIKALGLMVSDKKTFSCSSLFKPM